MQVSTPFDDSQNRDDLLQALREGREDAFSFIFIKYYSNLFSYARRILNDDSEAQECVQATFCHIWDIRDRLVIRDSIKSYLYRSIYNRCITVIRQKKLLAKYEDVGLLDLYFSTIIQDSQAEMRLIDSETRQVILQTIDSLPKKCKEIFVKCKIEGQSYADVANSLNISVKTVESQMAIALKRLREKLNWLLMIYF